jgi:hypothetical protein
MMSVCMHSAYILIAFLDALLQTSPIDKERDPSDGLLGSVDFSSSPFDSSGLSSCLHIPSQEDVVRATSDAGLFFEASIVRIPTAAPSTEDDFRLLDSSSPTDTLGFSLPNVSACGQELVLDALSAIGTVTHASGNDSPVDPHGYECDSVSSHSGSFSSRGISNIIARLGSGASASRASVFSWSQGSSRNPSPSPRITHHGHFDDGPFRSQTSTLQLSQPDGNNPWTLSLDPTLTSTESEAASQASTASLSLEAEFPPDDERPSFMSRDTLPSVASLQDPSSPHTVYYEEDIITTPRNSQSSPYNVLSEPRSNPAPSPLTYHHSDDSVRSKNFIQKTKELCNKFKKLISLKSVKERSSKVAKDNSGIRRTPLNGQGEPDTQSSFQNFPRITSPSFSSVDKPPAFRRTVKTSSPSVALSYTPDYTVARGSGSTHVPDEKYTYEYHARPKTLQEIRSKRRFSLPAFARPSSPVPPNARTANPMRSTKQRRAGSILSAEGGMTR